METSRRAIVPVACPAIFAVDALSEDNSGGGGGVFPATSTAWSSEIVGGDVGGGSGGFSAVASTEDMIPPADLLPFAGSIVGTASSKGRGTVPFLNIELAGKDEPRSMKVVPVALPRVLLSAEARCLTAAVVAVPLRLASSGLLVPAGEEQAASASTRATVTACAHCSAQGNVLSPPVPPFTVECGDSRRTTPVGTVAVVAIETISVSVDDVFTAAVVPGAGEWLRR